ncbi:FAD binding domain-containing protein [Sarocladium implicatum]|nr:FAD binding domain-containing protein [Sarocladium implicatum]
MFKQLALAALLSASAVTGKSTPECKCCSALNKEPSLQGKVYSPDDARYDARLETYYSANSRLAPWCMVMPESTEDVSTIVKLFNKHQCPFGMRSGSHTAFKLGNGIEDGVTVDFTYMNTTTYNEDTKVASVQPGSTWGESYEALDKYGVVNIGGRASVVGVGGFTTGGGYSFHSQTRGLACDAVSNFEVVLADGSVVNANVDENPDLFKSLKGGSGNFGFVTRVDQPVFPSNELWAGFTFFDFNDREKSFDAFLQFIDDMDEDRASQVINSFQWTGTELTVITVMSNIDAIPDAPIFENYRAINATSTTTNIGKAAELVPQFTGATPLGIFPQWSTGLVKNDKRILTFMADGLEKVVAKLQAASPGTNFEMILQFQPVTQHMVEIGKENGGNVLGLEDRVVDEPSIMWMILLTSETAEDQEVLAPIYFAFREECEQYAKDIDVDLDWQFLNYANGNQDPLRSYGEESIAFMKATSQKYDPEGMFQKLRKTGFHIPQ